MSGPDVAATAMTVKAQMIAIIEAQAEDSSFDDILRELAFNRVVSRGLANFGDGRMISTEELRRRIVAWRS